MINNLHIDDYNIIKIYQVLLNRKPNMEELKKSRELRLDELKKYITETKEFKSFKTQNIKKIRENVGNIINYENPKFNYEKMLKIFVNYNYNLDIFSIEFKKEVDEIQRRAQNFYLKNFNVKKSLSTKDLIEIINNNYNVESFIPTSEDFSNQCRIKIKELTCNLPC